MQLLFTILSLTNHSLSKRILIGSGYFFLSLMLQMESLAGLSINLFKFCSLNIFPGSFWSLVAYLLTKKCSVVCCVMQFVWLSRWMWIVLVCLLRFHFFFHLLVLPHLTIRKNGVIFDFDFRHFLLLLHFLLLFPYLFSFRFAINFFFCYF